MYVFEGLTWIDIIAVNLIPMHVLIILCSSCLIYLGMLRLTNMGNASIFATSQVTIGQKKQTNRQTNRDYNFKYIDFGSLLQ